VTTMYITGGRVQDVKNVKRRQKDKRTSS